MIPDYKLLIIGDLYDNHLIRFIRNLKDCNQNTLIDAMTFSQQGSVPNEIIDFVNEIYWFNIQTTDIRIIRDIQRICKLRSFLKNISKNNHYNVVNIHFPVFEYSFCVSELKKVADNIVLTPWGSDVYRAGIKRLNILKYLYRKADYICNPNTRFGKDVREIFRLRDNQIVNLSIGSDTIDYIVDHKDKITPYNSRKELLLTGDCFITCGYNASPAQNHKAIIDGIVKYQNTYPGKISLIFPMTYPKNEEYILEIKEYVRKKGLNAYFFTDYLDLHSLFCLRQSTDMFIHVQNTDANAASVQEYLLLGKNVLNGEWLRYDNMEIDGKIPYTLIKDLNSISNAIEKALNGKIEISKKLYDYIASYGWKYWIVRWDTFFKRISNIER